MPTPIMRRTTMVVAVIGASMLVGLLASSQASAGTIYACAKKNGTARLFTKKPKCKKGEKRLLWNIAGLNGRNGTNGSKGANGANGKEGKEGKEGKQGVPGQPQKAVAFNATLEVPGFLESSATPLFAIPDFEVSAKLTCFNFFGNFSTIEVTAPTGTRGDSGMVITNSENKAPEIQQEPIKDVEVVPTGTPLAVLSSNTKEPFANVAHLNASLATPNAVVLIDGFIKTGPNPSACVTRGVAFSIPR